MSSDYTNHSQDRSESLDRKTPAPFGHRKSETPVADSQQNVDTLRAVAQHVEAFLVRQIERLQQELKQTESYGDRHELARLTEEFEVMRRKWDAERQQERSRIQEDSQHLVEAWQRLEPAQRELLKFRSTNG